VRAVSVTFAAYFGVCCVAFLHMYVDRSSQVL
jgi:hypothetical protein